MNFFDNAEAYAGGESERIMGEAIAELGWARETYVVSTKLFWGLTEGVNTKNTLNRKYLLHAIDGSLRALRPRLRRPASSATAPTRRRPIEETVWAMSDIIDRGQGPLLGHLGVVGRRDPRRVGDRRPRTTCTSR